MEAEETPLIHVSARPRNGCWNKLNAANHYPTGAEMIAEEDAEFGHSVSELLRHLDDAKIAAVIATGATIAQVEEALLWAEGESDVLGKTEHPLTGAAARVYDILTAEDAFSEEP